MIEGGFQSYCVQTCHRGPCPWDGESKLPRAHPGDDSGRPGTEGRASGKGRLHTGSRYLQVVQETLEGVSHGKSINKMQIKHVWNTLIYLIS